MSTETVTHQDVINYIESTYSKDDYHKVLDGKLYIKRWIPFFNYEFSALPNDMVFDTGCDLEGSKITSIPEDIVLNGNLYLDHIKTATIPVLNISRSLYINHSGITISDCTYIGSMISSTDSKYEHLDTVIVNGYFFETGLLT